MSRVRSHISMSLDGYIAGPDPSLENPLGERGEELHEWAIATEAWRREHGREGGERNLDSEEVEEATAGIGAEIMGRGKFGGGPGPWDESWTGWWGPEPPFHMPVFVLTHHPRAPLEMEGGTTFHFVTEGVEAALEQAQAAAGGADVAIGGGAETIQQFIAADLLDELTVHIAPVLLGGGRRLFESVPDRRLAQIRAVGTSAATHVTYRVSA